MGRYSRRRRRTRITDLPDDLLELVLQRVRTPVCLFRAAATCKLWRRVIDGDGFLRRDRSRHRPNHLLGLYSVNITEPGFCSTVTEFVPFPERPAIHLRRRFSLDFLTDGEHMGSSPVLTDSRGGLLAFVRDNLHAVVCDPWTRQSTSLEFPWERPEESYDGLGAFILDAGVGVGDDESSLLSSFSVLCVGLIIVDMDDTTTAEACVFSARDDDNGWIRRTISSVVCTEVASMEVSTRVFPYDLPWPQKLN